MIMNHDEEDDDDVGEDDDSDDNDNGERLKKSGDAILNYSAPLTSIFLKIIQQN